MTDQGRYYSEETVAGLRKQVEQLQRERDEAAELLLQIVEWTRGNEIMGRVRNEVEAFLHRIEGGQDD